MGQTHKALIKLHEIGSPFTKLKFTMHILKQIFSVQGVHVNKNGSGKMASQRNSQCIRASRFRLSLSPNISTIRRLANSALCKWNKGRIYRAMPNVIPELQCGPPCFAREIGYRVHDLERPIASTLFKHLFCEGDFYLHVSER